MIRIEKYHFVAAGIIGVSVLVGLSPLLIDKTSVDTIKVTYNVSAMVQPREAPNSSEFGINPGKTLEFGEVQPHANYTKWIRLEVNDYSTAELEAEGNITEYLYFEDFQSVEGDVSMPVELSPEETGYYDGKMYFTVRKADNRIGMLYLKAQAFVRKAV